MGDPLTVRDGVCNLPESRRLMFTSTLLSTRLRSANSRREHGRRDNFPAARSRSRASGSFLHAALGDAVRARRNPSGRSERGACAP